jgi:D-alanyl-D-alanine carboxypeptidase (penicillin-binding protein 5/6)
MKKHRKALVFILILAIICGGYAAFALTRTLPEVQATINPAVITPQISDDSNITWPSAGESAVGILGTKILDSHNIQTPVPTASTAKLITALMVLKAKPLTLNDQGPTYTISANDVAIYINYMNEDGSIVQVAAGEQLTEYQMLQAMLLPSANNMADTLAIWAYGSLANYELQANSYLVKMNLSGTHVGADASGFQPTTLSTAHDLVQLGEIVMQNPVLSQIVQQPSVSNFPVVGTITNVNSLLGKENIIGVKTGNTAQAGGVFVGAAETHINGRPITVITANMGSPTLASSLSSSLPLIASSQSNYHSIGLINEGDTVATYKVPWQKKPVAIIIDNDLGTYVWNNSAASVALNLNPVDANLAKGSIVGHALPSGTGIIFDKSVNLSLKTSISKPSITWRLLHP